MKPSIGAPNESRRAQDILGRRIAVENVSSYATPGQEMSEIEFTNAVLKKADCDLLLDVNNVYVNSVNHRYDAEQFINAMPLDRVAYIHIAGHFNEADDLIVDSHAAAVIDPVWHLLDVAYARFGVLPTLLERDFRFPPLSELIGELDHIRAIQAKHAVAAESGAPCPLCLRPAARGGCNTNSPRICAIRKPIPCRPASKTGAWTFIATWFSAMWKCSFPPIFQ